MKSLVATDKFPNHRRNKGGSETANGRDASIHTAPLIRVRRLPRYYGGDDSSSRLTRLRTKLAFLCIILLLSGQSNAAEITSDSLTSSLLAAAQRGDRHNMKLLTGLGANINAVDHSGNNVVLMAALGGEFVLMKELLDQGVDPNVRGGSGLTPLAVVAMSGTVRAAQYLLDSGADPNLPCSTHDTPLHLAVGLKHNDMVRELLRANADVDRKNDAGDTPLMVAIHRHNRAAFDLLLEWHPDLYVRDKEDRSVLFIAILENEEGMALSLLTSGAPYRLPTAGYTPLHWARAMHQLQLVDQLERRDR